MQILWQNLSELSCTLHSHKTKALNRSWWRVKSASNFRQRPWQTSQERKSRNLLIIFVNRHTKERTLRLKSTSLQSKEEEAQLTHYTSLMNCTMQSWKKSILVRLCNNTHSTRNSSNSNEQTNQATKRKTRHHCRHKSKRLKRMMRNFNLMNLKN